MVMVIKRGGKLQKFDRNKLVRSMKNAGYNNAVECSIAIAKKIAKKSKVKSSDIAKMVVSEIKNNAALIIRKFASYRASHSGHKKKKVHSKHAKHSAPAHHKHAVHHKHVVHHKHAKHTHKKK